MKYPPKFFRDGLPEWKRKKDPVLSRLFYRPLSFYASSFFSEIGWSANQVSLFSIGVAVGSSASFVAGHPIIGSALMNAWLVLDCADGNIARCVKKEPYGDFFDGIAGYICSSLAYVGIGYCAYKQGGLITAKTDPKVILAGAIAGTCDALSRLVYQRFLNTGYEQGLNVVKTYNPQEASGLNKIRMKVDQFISIGGVLPGAVLAASLTHSLDIIAYAYGAYCASTLGAAVVYLSHKALPAKGDEAAE